MIMLMGAARRFWLDCRRALALSGLPVLPLGAGVVAGVDAHEGLPLDVIAALITAACVTMGVVLVLVLMHRILWTRRLLDPSIRRRMDR